MSDSARVDEAIVGLLLNDSALAGLMPDGVFFDQARKGAERFVIVSLVDEQDEGLFNGRATETALYLVKAVALSTTGADVAGAAARIDALLELTTFPITGYGLMVSRRAARIRTTEVDQDDASIRWQHRGGRYEVMVQPI